MFNSTNNISGELRALAGGSKVLDVEVDDTVASGARDLAAVPSNEEEERLFDGVSNDVETSTDKSGCPLQFSDEADGPEAPFHGSEDQEMEDTNDTERATAATSNPEDTQPCADDVSSDGKSVEAAVNDTGTEDGSSKDLPYSTRGRSIGSASAEEKSDRPASKDTIDDITKTKEPALGGVSFLESLNEEERRTRTRIIPHVEGMNALRKSEIKEDLALARSLPSIAASQTNIQTRTVRLTGSGRKKDAVVVDNEDTAMLVQDNRTITIELPTNDITVPSDAFVAPDGVVIGETEGTITVKDVSKRDPMGQDPSIVESTVAFNPPRPPESVGPKKKHRVLRWERRPEDIEVDMKNYRRTVQRTREELQKSEAEYERLETVDAHLRRHFLNHLEVMNDEHKRLYDEMQVEIERLMKESELVGSRTRSRNLTKVSLVMRDVLSNLCASAPVSDDYTGHIEDVTTAAPGIGGLNYKAFEDWDRFMDIKSMKPASSWLVPGQKISTTYGDGVVEAVFPPEFPLPSSLETDVTAEDTPRVSPEGEFQKTSNRRRTSSKNSGKDDDNFLSHKQEQNKYRSLKPARVQVRLPFGMGVFGMDTILEVESPAKYTDTELARRWKGMVESAFKVGPCIDLQGMSSQFEKSSRVFSEMEGTTNGFTDMDIDEGTIAPASSTTPVNDYDRFLPAGSSLFPTKGGRGNFLHKMSVIEVERGVQEALYGGVGVLGDKRNPGVTRDIRKWEDDEQEYLTLRSSVLQLKNALHRQRRIRILNERTSSSMNERYQRSQELVTEMRTDLKSLKKRLSEELAELGITEDMANKILSLYYRGQDDEDKGDISTPKRLRRASSVSREMLAGVNLGSLAYAEHGDTRDSNDEQGTDDLSGDDMEAQRPAKKA